MPDAPKRNPSLQEGEIDPWALAGLGLQFGLGLVIGAFAGQWVDRRFGSDPFGLLAGAFLLGGGIFVSSYRRLMARSKHTASGEAAQTDRADTNNGNRS
jgi:F0F1-type ATP synthase assembly protein I